MRPLSGVMALLLAALMPASSSAAQPAARIDWALLVVTAGPDGASHVTLTDEISGRGAASAVMFGALNAEYNPQDQQRPFLSCAIVLGGGGGGPSTKADLRQSGPIARLAPGERLAILLFFTGMDITRARQGATAASGSVRVLRVYGAGSRGISVKDGTPAPLGTEPGASYDANVQTGIAGGFVTASLAEDLAVDRATWTAPDGSTGSFVNGGLPVNGCRSPWAAPFTGSKGHWRWSWIGLSQSQRGGPVAAWAPIGPYWHLFRGAVAGPTGIDLPPASIRIDPGTVSAWPTS
ncbi:MAG TPA: hypothetical protein VG650_05840 [Mycobacteriales bacterium]|nr:hypothetical protein [Mycobacteriales bacterium]